MTFLPNQTIFKLKLAFSSKILSIRGLEQTPGPFKKIQLKTSAVKKVA